MLDFDLTYSQTKLRTKNYKLRMDKLNFSATANYSEMEKDLTFDNVYECKLSRLSKSRLCSKSCLQSRFRIFSRFKKILSCLCLVTKTH